MNNTITLTITALLTILLSSFHLADDVVKGIEPGGTSNYIGVLIMAVFLFATLMLGGRRWAHLIVLIGSIGGAYVPYLHMTGRGLLSPKVMAAGAIFFWVWTMLAMGATGSVSAVLAARGLWQLQWGKSQAREPAASAPK